MHTVHGHTGMTVQVEVNTSMHDMNEIRDVGIEFPHFSASKISHSQVTSGSDQDLSRISTSVMSKNHSTFSST